MNLPEAIRRLVENLPCEADSTGCSDAQVLLYPGAVLKIRPDSDLARRELSLLRWLNGRVRAPRILCSVQECGRDYLLMERRPGRMLCADEYLDDPVRLCEHLAEALHLLRAVDTDGCPNRRTLDVVLAEAEQRVAAGLCSPGSRRGFPSPEALLRWLVDNRPDETRCFTHGDLCLPNVLAGPLGVSGLIDLSDGGVADPYTDYALARQSFVRNMTGFFGGKVRPLPQEDLLFRCMGLVPDRDKLAYYTLLDAL